MLGLGQWWQTRAQARTGRRGQDVLERTDLAPVQRPGGDLDPAEHDPARLDLVGLGATAATSVAEALQHVVGTAVRALDAQARGALAARWPVRGGAARVVGAG
ncbi:hypothetical protein GCM10025868_11630 [Angustibacter aerolatus]|uniref:Uncharacterized protein n=1 Tax=Angustibacter aerolatus TaxID=1162965 RepID=A0ABQ6JCK2_9ACTN|nr:hypothetical protein [Angustibacter aerolatus]GMA85913.1 hypothetical protein GCM10025868_11630 [Angustibacter aerolatus]